MKKGTPTMKAILVATFALLTLSGCLATPQPEVIATVDKAYEVHLVGPRKGIRGAPRRFRVSVRDLESGKDLGWHKAANRCRSWSKLQSPSTWTFPETTYRHRNGATTSRVDVTGLCQRLGG